MEYSAMRRETYVPVPEPPKPPVYTEAQFSGWTSWADKATKLLSGYQSYWSPSKDAAREAFMKDTTVVQHDLKRGDNIVIHVTEEDIRDGSKGDSKDCAVVRALRRLTGHYDWHVPGDVAYLRHMNLGFKLPNVARHFIYEWDRLDLDDHPKVLQPFSFEATLVPLGHLGIASYDTVYMVKAMDNLFMSKPEPLDVEVPVPF